MNRKPIIVPRVLSPNIDNPYGYVYITTNLVNQKKYVGKHASSKLDYSYKGSGRELKLAIKKYGLKNFVSEPIEWVSNAEMLSLRELWWTQFLDAVENKQFYNEVLGGTGYQGGELHPLKGKHLSEYQKQRIKETSPHISGKDHPMYGDHRFAGKNNPMYGRKGKLSPTYGKKMSEEAKRKMSENHSDVSGSKNPAARAIVRLSLSNELLEIYDFTNKATQQGFNSDSIRDCCKGRKSSYKGFRWMYKEDYEQFLKEVQY